LNLALLVLTVGVLYLSTRAVARLTALVWLAWSVPHLVYHLGHLTMDMTGADKVGIAVTLSIPVVAALALWWLTSPTKPPWSIAPSRTPTERRPASSRPAASVGSAG
jgi:hypothetical protein